MSHVYTITHMLCALFIPSAASVSVSDVETVVVAVRSVHTLVVPQAPLHRSVHWHTSVHRQPSVLPSVSVSVYVVHTRHVSVSVSVYVYSDSVLHSDMCLFARRGHIMGGMSVVVGGSMRVECSNWMQHTHTHTHVSKHTSHM